jgi:hypothetical protein
MQSIFTHKQFYLKLNWSFQKGHESLFLWKWDKIISLYFKRRCIYSCSGSYDSAVFWKPRNFRYVQKRLESVAHALSAGTNQESVNYKFYLKYFKVSFALLFGRLQVNTCSTCDECKTRIHSPLLAECVKQVAVAEPMVHKRRAKKFYKKI